jgi:hypothetical protein
MTIADFLFYGLAPLCLALVMRDVVRARRAPVAEPRS